MLVFENSCYNCIHSDVCEKKRQFDEIQRKLKALEISLAGSDDVELKRLEEINWMIFKVSCTYHNWAHLKRKSKEEIMSRNAALNAARRKRLNTRG